MTVARNDAVQAEHDAKSTCHARKRSDCMCACRAFTMTNVAYLWQESARHQCRQPALALNGCKCGLLTLQDRRFSQLLSTQGAQLCQQIDCHPFQLFQ